MFNQTEKTYKNMTLEIVYCAYLVNGQVSAQYVHSQLESLLETKLLLHSRLHLVISAPARNNTDESALSVINSVRTMLTDFLYGRNFLFEIIFYFGNIYEYGGIHKVWEIAKRCPNERKNSTIILYFHSKGMVYNRTLEQRPYMKYFKVVVKPWERVINQFIMDPDLDTAGFAASNTGFQWINFWWARASFLSTRVQPIITKNRCVI